MSETGLNNAELEMILAVLKSHPEIDRAILFGSRAKGSARSNSDIDLALIGVRDAMLVEAVAMELEDLPLPYKFDVQALENISNVDLREHIQRVGVSLLEK